jgi:hypothetical protein
MSDIVVTVPKTFVYIDPKVRGLAAWISEGDAAGEPWSGKEWDYTTWGARPKIEPGERVYVVCEGRLRGYAPLIRLVVDRQWVSFFRGGGAVAVTIPEAVQDFYGWCYRWWDRRDEQPFPDWRNPHAELPTAERLKHQNEG